MPELPEVETVVQGLRTRGALLGRRVVAVRLGKTDFIDNPAALEEQLPGGRIVDIQRYGKFLVLLFELREGFDSRLALLVHLGMTGQLTTRRPEEPVALHTHVFFDLDDGRELRYTDARRFGRMALLPEPSLAEVLGPLGLDPLAVTEEEFSRRLAKRKARVKSLLLDQHVLRGLGNIYSDESLWRAKIHPARLARNLKPRDLARLRRAVRDVLLAAIRLRGSSVSDYVDAEGSPGEYQARHRVYGREGKRCFRCGAKIRRTIVAGRSSYFCPRCQRARRPQRLKR